MRQEDLGGGIGNLLCLISPAPSDITSSECRGVGHEFFIPQAGLLWGRRSSIYKIYLDILL